MKFNCRFCSAALLLSCLLLAGCSRGPRYYRVQGAVRVGGEPVEYVQVNFLPEIPAMETASGRTAVGGRFFLQSGNRGRLGIREGAYRVVFVQSESFGTASTEKYNARGYGDPASRDNRPPQRGGDEIELSLPPGMPEPSYPLEYYFYHTTPHIVTVEDDMDLVFDLPLGPDMPEADTPPPQAKS